MDGRERSARDAGDDLPPAFHQHCAAYDERRHVAADARAVDVTVRDEVDAWMREADADAPLDIVFANAGVSTGEESEENVRNTFAVNCDGTVNTVLRAIGLMRKRSSGHIVITASIAGYGGRA